MKDDHSKAFDQMRESFRAGLLDRILNPKDRFFAEAVFLEGVKSASHRIRRSTTPRDQAYALELRARTALSDM